MSKTIFSDNGTLACCPNCGGEVKAYKKSEHEYHPQRSFIVSFICPKCGPGDTFRHGNGRYQVRWASGVVWDAPKDTGPHHEPLEKIGDIWARATWGRDGTGLKGDSK